MVAPTSWKLDPSGLTVSGQAPSGTLLLTLASSTLGGNVSPDMLDSLEKRAKAEQGQPNVLVSDARPWDAPG